MVLIVLILREFLLGDEEEGYKLGNSFWSKDFVDVEKEFLMLFYWLKYNWRCK